MGSCHTKKIVEPLGAKLMFDVLEREPFACAKAQHDTFVVSVSSGERFNGGGATALVDAVDVFLDVFAIVAANIG